MSMLFPEESARLSSAESLFPSPIPVQSISSDEFMPVPQIDRLVLQYRTILSVANSKRSRTSFTFYKVV